MKTMRSSFRIFFSGYLLLAVFTVFFAACNDSTANAKGNDTGRKDSIAPAETTIRGVTYAGFVSMTSVDSLQDSLLPVMWKLWVAESWNPLDTLVTRNKINGGYPPAYGFVNVDTITLPVEKMLDRYGSLYGNFLADVGASFGGRSLPEDSKNRIYYKFKVLKPIPQVLAGKAIPWFGQTGMGEQYMVPNKINDLIIAGYLTITDSVPAKPVK